jgi:hypothetical protein
MLKQQFVDPCVFKANRMKERHTVGWYLALLLQAVKLNSLVLHMTNYMTLYIDIICWTKLWKWSINIFYKGQSKSSQNGGIALQWLDIWQRLNNHLQSMTRARTHARTHTCSIDPAIVGSTCGRLLLESSRVQPSHSIWCPPWLQNMSPWGPFSE